MTGNQCQNCAHYWGDLNCRAYPDGIPQDFLNGQKSHDKVEDDQEGEDVFKPGVDEDGNNTSKPSDILSK